jgi:NADPH:quinone reductase-like Zn-dependent oxidoreductase
MKAIVFDQYGSPDSLQLKEIPTPLPGDDEVLVRVHAASINEWDWGILKGSPFANRIATGLFRPRQQMLGADLAGRIEAVGKNVSRFAAGTDVMVDLCQRGLGGIPNYVGGAFAEYVCTSETALTLKPQSLRFDQAASLPQAGSLAVQGFRYLVDLNGHNLRSDQRILINGGLEVTGVCRTSKMDTVRSLGADHVIDYTKEDFTRNGKSYNLILDVMGFHSFRDCRRALEPSGCYVILGGADSTAMQTKIFGRLFTGLGSNKKMGLLIYRPNVGLDQLSSLIDSGKVSPVIDKTFPLEKTAEAFRYYAAGQTKGKVIITI